MNWFNLFIFAMGLIFTISVFPEFKSSHGTMSYLSLPASNLDKYATRWLYAIIILPLIITLTFALFNGMTSDTGSFMNLRGNQDGLFRVLKNFTFFNSLALMISATGSTIGKSFKEFVVTSSIAFGALCLLALIAKLIFNQYSDGWSINSVNISFTADFHEVIAPGFKRAYELAGYYLLPILFWVVGYFRFTEKEA